MMLYHWCQPLHICFLAVIHSANHVFEGSSLSDIITVTKWAHLVTGADSDTSTELLSVITPAAKPPPTSHQFSQKISASPWRSLLLCSLIILRSRATLHLSCYLLRESWGLTLGSVQLSLKTSPPSWDYVYGLDNGIFLDCYVNIIMIPDSHTVLLLSSLIAAVLSASWGSLKEHKLPAEVRWLKWDFHATGCECCSCSSQTQRWRIILSVCKVWKSSVCSGERSRGAVSYGGVWRPLNYNAMCYIQS